MAKYQEIESKDSAKGAHKDYSSNLWFAEKFCKDNEKSLLWGMRTAVVDSNSLKKSLLLISWRPPTHAKIGNSATQIFLHQNRDEVVKQADAIFKVYLKEVKRLIELNSWTEDDFHNTSNSIRNGPKIDYL